MTSNKNFLIGAGLIGASLFVLPNLFNSESSSGGSTFGGGGSTYNSGGSTPSVASVGLPSSTGGLDSSTTKKDATIKDYSTSEADYKTYLNTVANYPLSKKRSVSYGGTNITDAGAYKTTTTTTETLSGTTTQTKKEAVSKTEARSSLGMPEPSVSVATSYNASIGERVSSARDRISSWVSRWRR